MSEQSFGPGLNLAEQGRVLVVGAGGFTAENLYLSNLGEMGVPSGQITLVDNDEERLRAASERVGEHAAAFLDLDTALAELAMQGLEVPAIIIASSTAAHATNLRSIVNAANDGLLSLATTRIWCEKPVTPPETFDEIQALAAEYPDLDISVGYILRYSETLAVLGQYLDDNELSVTGLNWLYGKDRTKDSRPTQGVFPDEVVHPLSVTDLILTRAFGEMTDVDVESAVIQRRDFADPAVQSRAGVANPSIPKQPTSDVDTHLQYSFSGDGVAATIPVSISSSFLFEKEVRKVEVAVDGPGGPDVLIIEFDVSRIAPSVSSGHQRVDTLRRADGTVLFEWSGDKGAAQLTRFFDRVVGRDREIGDPSVSLAGEVRIQKVLESIGRVAVEADLDT